MSELPSGWVRCKLENCIEILDSMRKPVNNTERQARIAGKNVNDLYPYFGATGQVGYIDDYLFDGEYVALGEDGVPFFDPLKHKAYLLKGKTWVNNHAHVLQGASKVDNRYLCYQLNQMDYQGYVNGATRLKLTQENMRRLPILLAPLNEQIRIANKLDSLLAKVDAAQTRLEKIPTLLKRFRQSVLAAATSGELTREWRGASATEWQSLTIDEIAEVKGGKRLPKGEELIEENTGLPYIRAGQLKQGTVINNDDARSRQLYLTPEVQSKISRYTTNKGDVYLTIVGASIGDAGVIPDHYDGANLTENAAKITEFKKPLLSDYLAYWLRSQELQELIKLEIKSGAQGKLALKRIKELPVPYTDIKEQKEIVRRVESLFSLADVAEKQYAEAKQRINRLTQSLLAKAFRGELVPQDPNDEPAAELLKRIKLLREQESKNKPQKKRTSKMKTKAEVNKMKLEDAPTNYLTSLIKLQKEKIHANDLWKLSKMSIDDFYEKLRQEEEANLLVEYLEDQKDRMTENRYLIAC